MERPAGNIIQDQCLFFILGASDDLTGNLKKTAVRVARRTGDSTEYLLNMPVNQFMELVEDIIEADEEEKRIREQNRRERGSR